MCWGMWEHVQSSGFPLDSEASSPGDKGRTQDTGQRTQDGENASHGDKGRTQDSHQSNVGKGNMWG